MTTKTALYPFPTPKLQSCFEELENSVSQEGCSDDLAVCDGTILQTLFDNREEFDNLATKILITHLYSSMDDVGCEYPYAVIDFSNFEALKKHFAK
jgi:hypothetical protein